MYLILQFRMTPLEICNAGWAQKNYNDRPENLTLSVFLLTQYHNVTNGQTEGRIEK